MAEKEPLDLHAKRIVISEMEEIQDRMLVERDKNLSLHGIERPKLPKDLVSDMNRIQKLLGHFAPSDVGADPLSGSPSSAKSHDFSLSNRGLTAEQRDFWAAKPWAAEHRDPSIEFLIP